MKIAVVGPLYPLRGGIAHYTGHLAKHLAHDHEVRAYSFQQQYPGWLYPGRTQIDPSPKPLVETEARRWLVPWWPSSWFQVSSDWQRWRPALAVMQWWVPWMAPMTSWLTHSARRIDIPVVAICHNVLPHEHHRFDATLVRMALTEASRIIVHNADEERRVKQLVPQIETRTLSLPLMEGFGPGGWSKEGARATLCLDGNVLLFFGFVRPYKGLMDLIEALPAVLAELEVTLLVVGESWGNGRQYRERVAALGISTRVCFVDRYVTNNEAAMYFAAADLLVLPYRTATGSAVLQLAITFGVPVVATRAGGIADIVEDGATGFLVEPGDIAGLSRAVLRFFCENKAPEFQERIAQRRPQFSWETLVSAVLEVLKEQPRDGQA